MILEVKFNRTLPPFIRDLLNTYIQRSQNSAISKYLYLQAVRRIWSIDLRSLMKRLLTAALMFVLILFLGGAWSLPCRSR